MIAYTVPLFLRGKVITDDLVPFDTRIGASQFQAPDMSKYVEHLPGPGSGQQRREDPHDRRIVGDETQVEHGRAAADGGRFRHEIGRHRLAAEVVVH